MKVFRTLLSVLLSSVCGLILVAPGHAVECRSPQAMQLAFLEGEWRVESRFRLGGDPVEWETSTAESSIRALFPGCVWREEFRGVRGGEKLEMTGLFGYSNISDRLQHVWSHSQHGLLTYYEGELSEGSVSFVSEFEFRGTRVIVRKVITRLTSGFDMRTERSLDGGKNWEPNWFLKYSPRESEPS